MSAFLPLALVGCAAVFHAGWNYLVKRSGSSDVLFVWCCSVSGLPVAVALLSFWATQDRPLGHTGWSALVSMVLHTAYAVVLQKAYSNADMSLIYPIARGFAPVLVSIVALTWAPLPGLGGWFGIGLVVVGTVCMTDFSGSQRRRAISGVVLGLLVAVATASYTLWDAFSAQILHVDAIPYLAISAMAQSALLTGLCWKRRGQMIKSLRESWRLAAPVAILSPLSYGFVLVAMSVGPVGLVATARSLNIVVGTFVAAIFLHERMRWQAQVGVGMIIVGAVVSAL